MTAPLPARMASRYWCMYGIYSPHTNGTGKPTRKACAYCGGRFVTQAGLWGLVPHSAGSGVYRPKDVVRWYAVESAAEKAAQAAHEAQDPRGLVVRWFDSRTALAG